MIGDHTYRKREEDAGERGECRDKAYDRYLSAPIACEKRGSTGFFEMVVENIEKKPSRKR